MTPPEDDIHTARNDLLRAVNRLESLLADARESSEVALLRSVAHQLAADRQAPGPAPKPVPNPALKSYDPARFRRLLDLAGPDHAGELLARLAEDLETTRQTAATAAGHLDWPALRGASHVLISLAGSVGALSLQSMSEQLNTAATDHDTPALPMLMPGLLAELDALIAIVNATSPPERPSP